MKYWFAIILLSFLFESCDNKYDVIVEQPDGTVHKFICKEGKDTLNSTMYRFFDRVLVSKLNYINGKKEGSVINYHFDGSIKIITNYVNNKAHGINKVYSDSGKLIRRSFYINNKQVLFESRMVSEDFPGITRTEIIRKNKNNEAIWAGDLFFDQNNEPSSVGFLTDTIDSIFKIEYKGRYVNVIIDDTINLNTEYSLKLEITFPTLLYFPEILIGEFDKKLLCIDTSLYAKPDSLEDTFTFNYRSEKPGNNYIIGRLTNQGFANDDIYFFKGFYVNSD